MGRNIFQAENPVAMIQAVREVVHNKATVKQALDLYMSLSTGGKKKVRGIEIGRGFVGWALPTI